MFLPFEAFQQPEYLSDIDSWHGLIPVAFAVVAIHRPRVFVELGTHKGDSYAAFCQALDLLEQPVRAYAVDTWQGDEHAGFYGDDIFEKVHGWHEPRFGHFSRLVRSTFDDAVRHFADGSIDLLHIDGLHTYEAVKHDFNNWLPKMSTKGVVLFHDINVRESGFGVWRLWDELSENYPAKAFPFSYGLGVLGVGNEISPRMSAWLEADYTEWSLIISQLHALGEKVRLSGQVARQIEVIKMLQEKIQAQEEHRAQITQSLQSQVEILQSRLGNLGENHTHAQGVVAERDIQVTELQKRVENLELQLAEARHQNGIIESHLRLFQSSRAVRVLKNIPFLGPSI